VANPSPARGRGPSVAVRGATPATAPSLAHVAEARAALAHGALELEVPEAIPCPSKDYFDFAPGTVSPDYWAG
jgi:hypothetical protein